MNAFDAEINYECVRELNERNQEWVHLGFTEHAESAAEENLYLYLADVYACPLIFVALSLVLLGSLAFLKPHTPVSTLKCRQIISENTCNMLLWIKLIEYLPLHVLEQCFSALVLTTHHLENSLNVSLFNTIRSWWAGSGVSVSESSKTF